MAGTQPPRELVLVVDDDESVCGFLVATLTAADVAAVAAGSAADGLRLARRERPDVVVVDHHLPDQPGLALAEELKSFDPDLSVLMLTGDPSMTTAIAAVGHVDEFLVKPLEPDRLLDVVRAGLQRRTLRLQNARLLSQLEQLNLRLEDTLRDRTGELQALLEFATAIGAVEGLASTLSAALGAIARSVGSRHLAVYLESGGPLLRFAAQHGTDWTLPGQLPPPDRPVELRRVGSPPRVASVVEMTAAGRPTGALLLGHHRRANPLFLRTIAGALGVAVANAQRFERERETVERVSELAQLKSSFLATVSHELRTPLTAVLGFARTLQAHELDRDQQSELLTRIVEQADRLHRLVDDLLDATRLESRSVRLRLTPVPLAPLVRRVADSFGYADAGRVRTDVADDLPPVLADEDRLEQVLFNLVHNAVKYSPSDRPIEVSAALADGDRIGVAVRDHGRGIDPAFVPRVFDAFTQQDAGDTRRDVGVGLGLSIARGLLDLMGASVSVESTVGSGSTFTVLLRRAAAG